jgi:hypothetical protein
METHRLTLHRRYFKKEIRRLTLHRRYFLKYFAQLWSQVPVTPGLYRVDSNNRFLAGENQPGVRSPG